MEWPLAHAPFINIIVEESDEDKELDNPVEEEITRTPQVLADEENVRGTSTQVGFAERHVSFRDCANTALISNDNFSALASATQAFPSAEEDSAHNGNGLVSSTSSANTARLTATQATAASAPVTGQGSSAPRRMLRLNVGSTLAPAKTDPTPLFDEEMRDASSSARRPRGRAPANSHTGAKTITSPDDEPAGNKSKRLGARKNNSAIANNSNAHALPSSAPPLTSALTARTHEEDGEAAAETRRLHLAASRPTSPAACFDWWMYLRLYDTHALFTSQPLFETALRPLATDPLCSFYATLNHCFRTWRQAHWEDFVVLRSATTGGRRGAPSTSSSSFSSTSTRVVRDPRQLEYANAVWYEALRVQRLMVQHLLLTSTKSGAAQGRADAHTWWFPEACPHAFAAALGDEAALAAAHDTTQSSASCFSLAASSYAVVPTPHQSGFVTAAGAGAESGMTTLVSVTKKLSSVGNGNAVDGDSLAPTLHSPLLVSVPTASRVLLLLRVLDTLWSTTPTALPFRLPVSEMEAPHYYRSVKDPVSLCHLYEEVFAGITAPSLRACVRHREQRANKISAVLAGSPAAAAATVAGVVADVQSCFVDYAQLRERLATLKSNCDDYNGAGSELSRQAHQLLSCGARAMRDAVAEEDGRAAYLKSLQAQQPQHRDALFATVEDAAGAPHCLLPLELDELASEAYFASSASSTVAKKFSHQSRDGAPGANGEEETPALPTLAAPPRRALQLPIDTTSAATNAAAATDFWVQCDDCRTWHKLPRRLDPVPETWTCSNLGVPCAGKRKRKAKHQKDGVEVQSPRRRSRPSKAEMTADQKAEHAAAKAEAKRLKNEKKAAKANSSDASGGEHKKRGRKKKSESESATDGHTNATSDANDDHDTGDDDIPFAQMFSVSAEALKAFNEEAKTATTKRRGRRPRAEPAVKKARTALSAAPPSSSDDSRSSSSSSSSSSSGSSSSSSFSSSSSDDESDNASLQPATDAAAAQGGAPQKKTAEKPSRWSHVQTHALPKQLDAADADSSSPKKKGSGASHTTTAVVEQVERALVELERRRPEDDPFTQLEEIKRLEKQLKGVL